MLFAGAKVAGRRTRFVLVFFMISLLNGQFHVHAQVHEQDGDEIKKVPVWIYCLEEDLSEARSLEADLKSFFEDANCEIKIEVFENQEEVDLNPVLNEFCCKLERPALFCLGSLWQHPNQELFHDQFSVKIYGKDGCAKCQTLYADIATLQVRFPNIDFTYSELSGSNAEYARETLLWLLCKNPGESFTEEELKTEFPFVASGSTYVPLAKEINVRNGVSNMDDVETMILVSPQQAIAEAVEEENAEAEEEEKDSDQ